MGHSGNLIIVSGPSGAGKSALAGAVLATVSQLRFSVSYTTRAPRGTERNGVEYFFVNRDAFRSLISRQELLEWAEVHGNLYGTSRLFVDDLLQKGEDVLRILMFRVLKSSGRNGKMRLQYSSCRPRIRFCRIGSGAEALMTGL